MSHPLIVPARFNGPPVSANGGWFAGHLAALLAPGPVTVRLQAPPPLERAMRVGELTEHKGLSVVDGEHVVATAIPAAPLDGELVAPVSHAVAETSGASYEGLVDHPFPTCFSCGTDRSDGLGLRPGRVADGNGEYAAAWTPTEVTSEIVWAALDCPGGWSAGFAGRPMVLGTMTAQVERLPDVGEPCVIMAWPRGGTGRKFESASALYDSEGELLACAEATWIGIDPSSIRPKD